MPLSGSSPWSCASKWTAALGGRHPGSRRRKRIKEGSLPNSDSDSLNNPALNFENRSTDPTAPGSGRALLYIKDGAAYVRLPSGDPVAIGGVVALAQGRLAIGDGSGALSALALGTEGYVVTADASGFATWAENTGGSGGSDPNGPYQLRTTLYDNVLGSDTASWDIQNIPADYDDLEIRLSARGTVSAEYSFFNVRLNNDTTDANYRSTRMYGTFNDMSATAGDDSAHFVMPGANSPANSRLLAVMHILDYKNSSFRKDLRLVGAWRFQDAVEYVENSAMQWESASAISRITIAPVTGNLAAGSRLRIIGIL